MSISTKKKVVKLAGKNGGKPKDINAMSAKEAEVRAKAKIHIHIYVSKDGKIHVWGPADKPDIFRETLYQAAHIMEQKWKEKIAKGDEKVIELKPNIVIARK